MERTVRNGLDTGASPSEKFLLHDGATGKSFVMRDALDGQLQRARQSAVEEQQRSNQVIADAVNQLIQASQVLALVDYELDRRSRTLTIAPPGALPPT
jgi:hypothetical protein